MKQIDSTDRDQLQITSLNMMVDENSMVRLLDVFVDWALTHDLGLISAQQVTERPAFPVRTRLGIYIYGYINRIRSSRELSKARRTNIEVLWLIKGHWPCYKTIANFIIIKATKYNEKQTFKIDNIYPNFNIGDSVLTP